MPSRAAFFYRKRTFKWLRIRTNLSSLFKPPLFTTDWFLNETQWWLSQSRDFFPLSMWTHTEVQTANQIGMFKYAWRLWPEKCTKDIKCSVAPRMKRLRLSCLEMNYDQQTRGWKLAITFDYSNLGAPLWKLHQNSAIHYKHNPTSHQTRCIIFTLLKRLKKKTDISRTNPVSYAALGPLLFQATQSWIVTTDHWELTVTVSQSHDRTLCVG